MYYFRREKINPLLFKDLKEKQELLRQQIVIEKFTKPIHIIAGCDSAFIDDTILSVFVLFSYPELQELEVVYHRSKVTLPYVPGFLAFREIPNLLLAYEKLSKKPDLIMVDGHGIMHPRRMGIGAHLGVILKIPTIGVAKKKLVGKYSQPNTTKGSSTEVFDGEEKIGYALRSKDNIKPIFVSPGNLCDMETALGITLSTLHKHKLPEPTRIADMYSKKLKHA